MTSPQSSDLEDQSSPDKQKPLAMLGQWLRENYAAAAGLMLITAFVYAPVRNFDFLNWDDTWYIVRNDLIKSWHPYNLYRIATEPVARNFAPLTIGTFLIEHTLWGLWAGGYHLTNVALHALNALLVFGLLKRLTKNSLLAWSIAGVFALHPLQVEVVAWVSSRKTLLSSTFMLASLHCWLQTERTSRSEGWGILWLVLGLLSKASTVVIPPIVVAWDVIICRKKFSESFAKQVVPMFFCVMLILLTMSAQTTIVGGVRGHIGASKLWIFAIDCTILWRYVAMMLYPTQLAVLYDPATTGITHWIALSVVSWLGIAYACYRNWERYPEIVFCLATWLLLLIPVLNLFPITTLMNDRYLYLPLIPFFMACVLILKELLVRVDFKLPQLSFVKQPALTAVSLVVISFFSNVTLNYLPVWSQPLTLWHHAQEQTPSLTVVQIQWALTLKKQGATLHAINTLKNALTSGEADEYDRERIENMLNEWQTAEDS